MSVRVVMLLLAVVLSFAAPAAATPTVSPAPQEMHRVGPDVTVPARVELVVDSSTDEPARTLLEQTLRAHGVRRIDARENATGHAPFTVHLGPADRRDVADALAGTAVPDRAEGSALRVGRRTVALGGTDAAGQYYAVQTLRQLFTGQRQVASVAVSDFPAMPLRGTIEGFYGSPWTHAERLDQFAFYGAVKANTYIYAPKDDPYHRDRWREPYPPDLEEIGRAHV